MTLLVALQFARTLLVPVYEIFSDAWFAFTFQIAATAAIRLFGTQHRMYQMEQPSQPASVEFFCTASRHASRFVAAFERFYPFSVSFHDLSKRIHLVRTNTEARPDAEVVFSRLNSAAA